MYARFLEVKVKPEAIDQGLALEHQIVSFLKQMSGFRGVVTLITHYSLCRDGMVRAIKRTLPACNPVQPVSQSLLSARGAVPVAAETM